MSKKISKELKEWIVFLSILGILFFTGWGKDLIGLVQRGILETGVMRASELKETRPASYDFQLINEAGRTLHFSEFEGKTVFMNIWATWCPPCIAEMPDIHDLYEKIGEDVAFVMISVDKESEKALTFVDSKEFKFPIYFLKNGLPGTYNTQSIPSTFVISPNGDIVAEEHGLSKYDTEKFRNFLLNLNKSQPVSGNADISTKAK